MRLLSSFVLVAMLGLVASTPAPQGESTGNPACSIWLDVRDDMQSGLFNGAKCENGVHKALRLAFHDSIGFSQSLTASGQFGGGGSDGSIIEHSAIELTFGPNGHLEGIVEPLRTLAIKHGVSFADIIQFAAAVGVANCRGAPRLEFMAGRSNSSQPSPPRLVPGPGNSVDQILSRMADAGFSADETVDLLASHSIAAQEGLNSAVAGSPFDSTPDVFDTQFYVETLLKGILNTGPTTGFAEKLSPLPGEFRMQSDFAIARDPRTACRWQALTNDPVLMSQAFRAAMVRLSTLGNDRSTLQDCSDVIPIPNSNPTPPTLPGGKTEADIEASCPDTPFPVLPIAPGVAPPIPPVAV